MSENVTGAAPSGGPRDDEEARARRSREAEQAHGGSMAPGLVDETGRPAAEPPAAPPAADQE
jgi:hypothetical protein